jgi:hypothetical protein
MDDAARDHSVCSTFNSSHTQITQCFFDIRRVGVHMSVRRGFPKGFSL